MPAPYSAGSIFLQVVPSFRGVPEQIQREAREWGDAASKDFDESFEKGTLEGVKKTGDKAGKVVAKELGTAGKEAAKKFSDEFERETRTKKLFQHVEKDADEAGKKAAKNLTSHFDKTVKGLHKSLADQVATIKVSADDREAQKTFRQLKRDIALLDAQAEIGMSMNSGATMMVIGRVRGALHDLQDTADNIKARVDFANVYSEVAKTEAALKSLSMINIEPELKLDRQLGAFERGIKSAIDGALRDLGSTNNGAGSSAGERAVADLRKRLFDLGDLDIGVDISAESAVAEIELIRDELESLQREHWDIRLDADTAAASAALDKIIAAVRVVDGQSVDIDVDVKDAVSAISSLNAVSAAARKAGANGNDGANSFRAFNIRILGVAALGPLVVPALAAIGGGIAALIPLAAAAGAGIGVMVLAFLGIGDAVKAMGDARAKAASDAQAYEKSVRSANQGVEDAERSLARARESAAQANAGSARQIEDAQRGVQDALQGVEDAERNLQDAQRSAQQAQEDLTRARRDAAEQLEDLNLRVRDGAIDQRQAALDLREAEQRLNDARSDPKATADDIEGYSIALERAKLRIDQVAESNGDLSAEQEKFARTGIEGSDLVVAAQQRVADANRQVEDASRGVHDAQQRVADAERSVSDARAQAAQTALDGQRSIQDAQRSLSEAQTAYTEAVKETTTAQDKLNQSMNNLGPAGRDFATYIDGLKPKFQYLRSLAQEGLLPGLTEWIDSIVTYHGPLLESTISGMSGAIGDMFSQFARSIKGPEFTEFFKMVERSGPTFIGFMGTVLTNLGEGVAGLATAMEPLGYLFGQWLVDASEKFNRWANSLQGSKGLRTFFEYIAEITPKVAEFLYNLADALVQIGIALAPYAGGLLNVFDTILAWIAELDPSILGPIVLAIGGTVLALQTIFGLTAMAKSFQTALHLTGIELDGLASSTWKLLGPWAILAAAIFLLYQNSDTFRKAADTLWHEVLEPLFGFLGDVTADILIPLFEMLGDNIEVVAGIAAAWASWKIITQVVSWVASLRLALLELAGAQALVGMSAGAAGGAGIMRGVTSRAGMGVVAGAGAAGVGTAAGAAAGGAALGVGAGIWAARNSTDRDQEAWVKALMAGGADAAAAHRDMDDATLWEKITFNMGHWGNTEDVVTRQTRETTDAINEQFAAMSPLEQAQSKVAEWSATLAYRQDTLGDSHENTRIAQERLTYWTGKLDESQGALDEALSSVNEALVAQQGLVISLAEADIAYSQSSDALTEAHDRAKDALAQYGAESQQYKDALAGIETQSLSTAQAAARVAEVRHSDADATEKQQWANAALLADLIRQEEAYGSLPPRLQQMKDDLLKVVPATFLATTQMENLGLSVLSIPNSREIVIAGDTPKEQLDVLEQLGLKLETDMDGNIHVIANTDAAAAALDEFINTERNLTIDADVSWRGAERNFNQQQGRTYYGQVQEFSTGGAVFGPGTWTSDSIPAYLSDGEYVVKAASVAKYGLDFFHAVNEGRFGQAFSRGGQAKKSYKNGRRAFKDGGGVGGELAVNWGGSMSLTGGDVSPLAQVWWQAVSEINAAASAGVNIMAKALNIMAKLANGAFIGIARQATESWTSLTGTITLQTTTMLLQVGVALERLKTMMYTAFETIRMQALGSTSATVWGIKGQWDALPAQIAVPVNIIIEKVINGGLLGAFNNIVGQLGASGKELKSTPSVKLAAGGKVPGWSPHDKADNIPAWLTAGEFVQPVDVVNHYGVDFMEKLRKKELPRYATGGYVAMSNVIKQQFPWARITSTVRPGDPGYHGSGQAIDIGGAIPYPDKTGMKQMLEINRWLAANFANITELIHTQPGAINLWHGAPHTYNGATQAEHRNHVHWAMAGALLAGGGNFAGMAGLFDPGADLSKAVEDALAGFGTAPMHNILAEIPRRLVGMATERLTKLIEETSFAIGDAAPAGVGLSGDRAANKALVQRMAAARGWIGGEWTALDQLIMKESGYNNLAQNPTSTAFGMFQFLNGTWSGYGIPKTTDPAQQTEAGFRYISSKYGSPSGALRFHLAHNWYGDGGEVKPNQGTDGNGGIVPDLHDTGGWLQPGLNVIMNRTNRPEPTINPQTLDALQSIAAGGGGTKQLIGAYHQTVVSSSPREAMDELLHALDVTDLGGRYSGVNG